MDTSLQCVNRGGPLSHLLLADNPILESEISFATQSLAALMTWQARPGEILSALAPDGKVYRVRITRMTERRASCVPFSQIADPEPATRIYLFQALPEKERFELVLQKAVELGVAAIVPFVCNASTTLAARDSGQRKSHRWPDVILRAVRQCRRRTLPQLYPVLDWDEALAMAAGSRPAFFCHPNAQAHTLKEHLSGIVTDEVSMMVGPEGGFCDAEQEQAAKVGLLNLSLGSRILRTETAAIAALAQLSILVD